ncbi:TetR/AcrR family transcriptional regulator [Bordetella genomosp. 5]|uniref:TetR family transcriptional regulator n=1 Tax=Bordetella genomosp. 5 TaxID=1395608 RepID=A0A261T8N2_9BORD|nr:TetR/AcrR family transcriptional regulator [Bordetella genomosp. 5]OZI45661.1 TetR family transcriptional regulator [Bordetella genomosp. 5]
MTSSERPAPRGRPRTITHERIAEAGVRIGLPNLSYALVAAELGVSHMALYKHVASLDGLKCLVAEEMFRRWEIPRAQAGTGRAGLKAYLQVFAAAVRDFVRAHPGVTPFTIRRLAATPAMLEKIVAHQRHIAEACELSMEQARWLLATIAFHGMAVADTVYTVAGRAPEVEADRSAEEAEMEGELEQGMQALIAGALLMLEEGAPG